MPSRAISLDFCTSGEEAIRTLLQRSSNHSFLSCEELRAVVSAENVQATLFSPLHWLMRRFSGLPQPKVLTGKTVGIFLQWRRESCAAT